jgi:hypothetical protein
MLRTDRLGCRLTPPPHRSRTAVALYCAAAFLLSALLGCSDSVGPPGPPYLAIVTQVSRLPGAVAPETLTYRVWELSGTLGFDRTVRVAAGDTIILSVPPATFVVDLEDVPASCFIREGPQRGLTLSRDDNTGLVRYAVQCRSLLDVQIAADGYDVDTDYLLRVRSAAGFERVFAVGGSDTISVNDVPPDTYEVELGGVAENCVVTNLDGARQLMVVDSAGGAVVDFRIRCSVATQRPEILSFIAGNSGGVGVFAVTVTDASRDIDGYEWDLTDCQGRSVLPDRRRRSRRNVRAGRAALGDTVTIVGVFDLEVSPDVFTNRCQAIRVFDFQGNTSEFVVQRMMRPSGSAPRIAGFNSLLIGTAFVQTAMVVTDADGDIVGHFVSVLLRDGTLNTANGQPDVGVLDPAGFLGTEVRPIYTSARIPWDAIYVVTVWVIDAGGNVVRVDDSDVFR